MSFISLNVKEVALTLLSMCDLIFIVYLDIPGEIAYIICIIRDVLKKQEISSWTT